MADISVCRSFSLNDLWEKFGASYLVLNCFYFLNHPLLPLAKRKPFWLTVTRFCLRSSCRVSYRHGWHGAIRLSDSRPAGQIPLHRRSCAVRWLHRLSRWRGRGPKILHVLQDGEFGAQHGVYLMSLFKCHFSGLPIFADEGPSGCVSGCVTTLGARALSSTHPPTTHTHTHTHTV